MQVTTDLEARAQGHWNENKRLIVTLLIIWFVVSYIPVFFAEALNGINIFGFPLAYYMGAQGSLVVFVIEIFYYAYAMDRIDRKYGMQEEY